MPRQGIALWIGAVGAGVETTYKLTTANCTGWYCVDTDPDPNTLTLDSETELSGADQTNMSTDDANYDGVAAPPANSAGHHMRYTIVEAEEDVTDLIVTAKGYGWGYDVPPSYDYGYYLYIWNFDTTDWELLDSGTASSKETLSGSITSNWPNYIDGSSYVHTLVTSKDSGNDSCGLRTYYTDLVVTAAAPAGHPANRRFGGVPFAKHNQGVW